MYLTTRNTKHCSVQCRVNYSKSREMVSDKYIDRYIRDMQIFKHLNEEQNEPFFQGEIKIEDGMVRAEPIHYEKEPSLNNNSRVYAEREQQEKTIDIEEYEMSEFEKKIISRIKSVDLIDDVEEQENRWW